MISTMVSAYLTPTSWIRYDAVALIGPLTEAKAAVMSLTTVPYQRSWAEKLQEIQLKQEVAGTSRIEGAEFTESELDKAISNSPDQDGMTRSQRQARAAVNTYRWIARLPPDRPITQELILEIHRRIVTGCDDDHCEPGALRKEDQNVTFGSPRHRGVSGGRECAQNFAALAEAASKQFRDHDVLIQALALHYHIGAMHPFLDGNGRTARALEALMLQRSGLKDALFIALSNYYYDEKDEYLRTLAEVRKLNGDLTPFMIFGLKGISSQCRRLLNEINRQISKILFRDMAHELFGTLRSPKKRIIAKRQLAILNYLLEHAPTEIHEFYGKMKHIYSGLKDPFTGYVRDVFSLNQLKAISLKRAKSDSTSPLIVDIRLVWPTEITSTQFFNEMQKMPKAKTFDFLQKVSVQQDA